MNYNLHIAHWEHSKKMAKLIAESSILIEMEFSKKATSVKIGEEKFEFSNEGFWCPPIIIRRKSDVVAMQKHLGLWGTKSEFEIDEKIHCKNKTRDTFQYYLLKQNRRHFNL